MKLPVFSRWLRTAICGTLSLLLACTCSGCGRKSNINRSRDVVYGRKYGTALTFDMIRPFHPNGAAMIWLVSGGWRSEYSGEENTFLLQPFLRRGYTVFLVRHGGIPRFNIVDILSDVQRAVRYIRFHCRDFHIDPNRIAVHGASSGGHLALLLATAPRQGNSASKDDVDKEEARVGAVIAVAPPTDFLNYGAPGQRAETGILRQFAAGFDYDELNPIGTELIKITDPERRDSITAALSPINQVTADDAPTLIFHGDKDTLVPIEQSSRFCKRMDAAGVPCKLVIKQGLGHTFSDPQDYAADMEVAATWLEQYMVRKRNTR